MTRSGSSYFFEHLSNFTIAEFRCFVADLWSMRGWQIVINENVIILTHPRTRERQYLHVIHAEDTVNNSTLERDFPVDLIATNIDRKPLRLVAQKYEAQYIGPTQLREMVGYAIDPEAGKRLLTRYFDRPFSLVGYQKLVRSGSVQHQPEQPQPTDSDDIGENTDETLISSVWSQNLQTAVMVSVLIVVGLTLIGFAATPQATVPPIDDSSTQLAVDFSGSSPVRYPSGLNATGIRNVTKLAQTHVDRIQHRSYDLVITHAGSRGAVLTRSRWIRSQQIIHVNRSAGYRYNVNGTLSPATIGGRPQRIHFIEYSNKTACRRFSLIEDRFLECMEGGSIRLRKGMVKLINRFFDTSESRISVIENGHRYRIVATGDPHHLNGEIIEYRAVAVIDRSGIIWRVHVEYRSQLRGYQNQNTIRFSFRYQRIRPRTTPEQTRVTYDPSTIHAALNIPYY